jgi:predicted lipoprotein with Yx(FWY)xxD motif
MTEEVIVTRTFALAAAATTLALLIAGCGSSGTTTGTTEISKAAQTAPAATSTPGVVVVSKHSKLGTVLAAGSKRLTVYLFEADKGSTSSCTGECAKVWPPVITAGTPTVGGSAVAADLGTTTRSDGTKQVTYKGHPIYFYVKDGDSGDTYGEGVNSFGADWYVLAPSGNKIDNDEGSDHGDADSS